MPRMRTVDCCKSYLSIWREAKNQVDISVAQPTIVEGILLQHVGTLLERQLQTIHCSPNSLFTKQWTFCSNCFCVPVNVFPCGGTDLCIWMLLEPKEECPTTKGDPILHVGGCQSECQACAPGSRASCSAPKEDKTKDPNCINLPRSANSKAPGCLFQLLHLACCPI